MKKQHADYRPEKARFGEYLAMFRGIKMPWLFIALIFVATVCNTFATLNISTFTGEMVDANGSVPAAQLATFALSYLLVGLCTAGSSIFQGVASERINLGLRKKLWRKIIYTQQSCYDADGGETLVSRVTTDCDYASKLLTTIVGLVSLAFSMVTYLNQMYAMNITLSNYMLLLIPLSALIGWGYARLRFLVAQKTQAMLSRATTYLVERTANLSLIKTANAQQREIEQGRANFQEQYVMQVKTGLMECLYEALQTLYNIVSIIIPFSVGAALVSQGVLTTGDVIAFYAISGSVGVAFTNVIDYAGELWQSNGALARVINTMKLPDEQDRNGRDLNQPDEDIQLADVTFDYGQEPVLSHVTCRIPKHKITAVIGANGSGKSTLFKLVERLYEPRQGRISFGQTDVGAYDIHAWRRKFSAVAQGSPLMEGTIRENICYGCQEEASEEELLKVAKLAHVYDFVQDLPRGFDTQITSGGQNLSGGQRQCVAIARAMMCSPDYLLLDEATSSLDAKSERGVMEALDELMKGRTTVIIAHSLAAIRRADHVIVLRDGQVEASGAPAQILEAADNYLSKVMGRKRIALS